MTSDDVRYTIHKTGDFSKVRWVWQVQDWGGESPPSVVYETGSLKEAEKWVAKQTKTPSKRQSK